MTKNRFLKDDLENAKQLFGIDSTTKTADIKRIYKKLAIKLHPDKNKEPDAQQKFQNLQNAYELLLNNTDTESYYKNNFFPETKKSKKFDPCQDIQGEMAFGNYFCIDEFKYCHPNLETHISFSVRFEIPCKSKDDFSATFVSMHSLIDNFLSLYQAHPLINITATGMLNGKYFEEMFNDLNSCKQYFKENLMEKSKLKNTFKMLS